MCIFCRIINKETETHQIFEDGETLAFLDTHPLAKGHTLVIPKRHVVLLEELSVGEAQHLFLTVHRLIKPIKHALQAPATTIAINNGRESGQEVQHAHVHIIPRFRGDRGGPIHAIMTERPYLAYEEMNDIAARIRELLMKQPNSSVDGREGRQI